jgi:hypothetical protein
MVPTTSPVPGTSRQPSTNQRRSPIPGCLDPALPSDGDRFYANPLRRRYGTELDVVVLAGSVVAVDVVVLVVRSSRTSTPTVLTPSTRRAATPEAAKAPRKVFSIQTGSRSGAAASPTVIARAHTPMAKAQTACPLSSATTPTTPTEATTATGPQNATHQATVARRVVRATGGRPPRFLAAFALPTLPSFHLSFCAEWTQECCN